MRSRRILLPEISPLSLSVSHVDIDSASPLNQNESHIHKECEIYLNLSGDVSFEVENRIYPISRGCAVITRPYEYHHCIYHSPARHEHYWITFSAGENDSYLQMFFGREKGHDNLIRLEPSQLEALLLVLQELQDPGATLLQLCISSLQMFRLLAEGTRLAPLAEPTDLPQDVAAALRFMDSHLAEDMDIRSLAAAGNVSVNTLERHFREALGTSPFSFLRRKRLIASMTLLRSGMPVTETALQCGFPDYSNYIQLFRKQFGITPLQYRKKLEQDR